MIQERAAATVAAAAEIRYAKSLPLCVPQIGIAVIRRSTRALRWECAIILFGESRIPFVPPPSRFFRPGLFQRAARAPDALCRDREPFYPANSPACFSFPE